MNGKFTRIDVSTDQQLLRGCCDADASPTIFARATLNMNFPGTGGGGSLCLHFTQGVTGLRGVAVFFLHLLAVMTRESRKGPSARNSPAVGQTRTGRLLRGLGTVVMDSGSTARRSRTGHGSVVSLPPPVGARTEAGVHMNQGRCHAFRGYD
jgi:hypothetical protein